MQCPQQLSTLLLMAVLSTWGKPNQVSSVVALMGVWLLTLTSAELVVHTLPVLLLSTDVTLLYPAGKGVSKLNDYVSQYGPNDAHIYLVT